MCGRPRQLGLATDNGSAPRHRDGQTREVGQEEIKSAPEKSGAEFVLLGYLWDFPDDWKVIHPAAS